MKLSNWVGLSSLIFAVIILWSLKDILIQLFAGLILAMAICTIVNKIRAKFPLPRNLALIISLLTGITILVILLTIVIPPFTNEFQELITQLPTAAFKLWEIISESIEGISRMFYGQMPQEILNNKLLFGEFSPIPDGAALANGVADGIKKIFSFAGNLGSFLLQFLFIFSVGLMVSIQPEAYRDVAIKLIPSFYRKRSREILSKCGDAIGDWMVGVIISSIFVSILAGIGLSILGVKLVIANALLAGLLNIIPNVGPVISTIFPISVALLDAPWKALAVLGMYIFIQNLESYVITPSIMHHQLKLLPGLTLTAQFIFTVVFGPIGLLLALPLAVVLQVLTKEIIITDLLDNWKKESIKLKNE